MWDILNPPKHKMVTTEKKKERERERERENKTGYKMH